MRLEELKEEAPQVSKALVTIRPGECHKYMLPILDERTGQVERQEFNPDWMMGPKRPDGHLGAVSD